MTLALAAIGGALTIGSPAPAGAAPFRSGSLADPVVVDANTAIFALAVNEPDQYHDALVAIAAELGRRLGVDPARFVDVWSTTDTAQMRVLLAALTQLGVGYRYASARPGVAFDCSGLVSWAWSQAGITLPTQSSSIIRSMPNTSLLELEPGDVLWYPGHVMLSLGVDDTVVHAVHRGRPVEVDHVTARKFSRLRAIDPLG